MLKMHIIVKKPLNFMSKNKPINGAYYFNGAAAKAQLNQMKNKEKYAILIVTFQRKKEV